MSNTAAEERNPNEAEQSMAAVLPAPRAPSTTSALPASRGRDKTAKPSRVPSSEEEPGTLRFDQPVAGPVLIAESGGPRSHGYGLRRRYWSLIEERRRSRFVSSARPLINPFSWSFVVAAMVVVSTVKWQTDAYFEGGFDDVAVGKAALTATALVIAATLRIRYRGPLRTRGTLIMYLVAAFAVFSAFGGIYAGNGSGSVILSIRLIMTAATLVLLVSVLPPDRVIYDVASAMGATALVGAATGWGTFTGGAGRLAGGDLLPLHPNELALLAAVPAVVIVWRSAQGIARLDLLLLLPVFGAIVWLTGSRTGLAAMLAAMLVCVAMTQYASTLLVMATTFALAAGAALTILTPVVDKFVVRGNTDTLDTLSTRTNAWEAALAFPPNDAVRWLGSGLIQKLIPAGNKWRDTQPLDNSWVSAFVQGGIVGLGLLVVAVMVTIAGIARLERAAKALYAPLIVLLVVRSFLESGLLDSSPPMILLVVLAATSNAEARRSQRADRVWVAKQITPFPRTRKLAI